LSKLFLAYVIFVVVLVVEMAMLIDGGCFAFLIDQQWLFWLLFMQLVCLFFVVVVGFTTSIGISGTIFLGQNPSLAKQLAHCDLTARDSVGLVLACASIF